MRRKTKRTLIRTKRLKRQKSDFCDSYDSRVTIKSYNLKLVDMSKAAFDAACEKASSEEHKE